MSPHVQDVTAVIVNYKTRDLTARAVETLRRHYAELRLILIDNGSHDDSTDLLLEMADLHPNVATVINQRNRFHGPAMHQGIELAQTPYVFTLDSDCEVIATGFLERMLSLFSDNDVYAVGELRYKNRFGYTYGYATIHGHEARARPENRRRIPYVHPYAMLLDRAKYFRLHPFEHHGAPCIKNMRAAKRAGYVVRHFPIHEFVIHHAEGTSSQHGYGFRARSRQVIEQFLTNIEGFVLRDPVVKIQHRRDRR
jgi:glycosyltransferase involved in cell wall biosynthesis